jgi:tRNA A58 N-methylase Trm61
MILFLSRAVGPSGRVHTWEKRREFSEGAQKVLFQRSDIHISLSKRSRRHIPALLTSLEVCKTWNENPNNVDFFVGDVGSAPLEPEYYDAACLDLMEPWTVIDNVGTPALSILE